MAGKVVGRTKFVVVVRIVRYAEQMTDQIVAMLVAERDKLNRAIEALGGTTEKRRGRPPGSTNKKPVASVTEVASVSSAPAKRKGMSAAGRKAIADAARRRWRLIKAGKLSSPFAKKKAK
jgi:hypothetical protein